MFKYFLLISLLVLGIQNCYAELVDPTRPANYKEENAQPLDGKILILSAIMVGSKHQLAIINGQGVQIGDTITGYKVLEIKPHVVRLLGPNGAFDLPLVQQAVKNPARQGLVK